MVLLLDFGILILKVYEPDSISVKIRGKANGYFYTYDDADKKNILGKIAIVVNDKKNFCCVKDSLTVPKRIVHFTLNTRVRDI